MPWGTSASFVDYDRDGWLDFVVVHYLDYDPDRRCTDISDRPDFCPPHAFPGTVSRLFRNRSCKDGRVRFEDVTMKSGLGKKPGSGPGALCYDFNGDGWPDIFIANDRQPNYLWINNHDGTFQEQGCAAAWHSMPRAKRRATWAWPSATWTATALDLFITHLTEETHTLWRQTAPGLFQDRTAASGLANPRWHGTGFGTVMADFDHDGCPDIAVVNGRVMYGKPPEQVEERVKAEVGAFWSHYADRNQLFLNDGKGGFLDVSSANDPFCGPPGVYRGLAYGDIDNDGAIDLLSTCIDGPARLFKNVATKRGHSLTIRILDPALKRDAYGAEVTVTAGERRWKSWLNPGSSFLCSNDPRVHFGLGAAEKVDKIEVQWPDGVREQFAGCSADQAVELRRGISRPISLKRALP